MERLPLEVQTLHAELLEQLVALEAARSIGNLSGSFVTKTIKGAQYCYFQYLEPGGAKKQVYLGRRDAALDDFIRHHGAARDEVDRDVESITRLASLLRVGGAMVLDAPTARVIKGLSDAGVFRLGGVLVGTHAFSIIGNQLGVRWSGQGLRTQDVDIAVHPHLAVAIPDLQADLPEVLESLQMGFLPVPGLNPASPHTSFKVRGQGLRVDLLAAVNRARVGPVAIRRLGAAAQPLRFLDYVIEESMRAPAINSGAVLVNVPDPARFALHKLIVAAERPATMSAKRRKDLIQAEQVLGALLEDRPGDIELAVEGLRSRGPSWLKRVNGQLAHLDERVSSRLKPLLAQSGK